MDSAFIEVYVGETKQIGTKRIPHGHGLILFKNRQIHYRYGQFKNGIFVQGQEIKYVKGSLLVSEGVFAPNKDYFNLTGGVGLTQGVTTIHKISGKLVKEAH